MVQSLKELEKLLKLCRKQGVTEIALGEVSFKLGDIPRVNSNTDDIEDDEGEFINALETPMSQEEMAIFANGGNPDEAQ